jgi:hypothetical protein
MTRLGLSVVDRSGDGTEGVARAEPRPTVDLSVIRRGIDAVAARNYDRLAPGSELGICAVVTPGSVRAFVPAHVDRDQANLPKVLVHSYRLPFEDWRDEFRTGVRLAVSNVCDPPASVFPKDFKHRSRLHYHLAQLDVSTRFPGCRPVLLSLEGHVADGTTAGLLAFDQRLGWISPPAESALTSVTVAVLFELLAAEGIGFACRTLTRSTLHSSPEVLWCGTTMGPLPVVEIDGRSIGTGRPGPEFQRVARLWSDRVGLDYLRQVIGAE